MPVKHLGPKYHKTERLTYEFFIYEDTQERFDAIMDVFDIMVEEIGKVIAKHSEPSLR